MERRGWGQRVVCFGDPVAFCILTLLPTLGGMQCVGSGILDYRIRHLLIVLIAGVGSSLGGIETWSDIKITQDQWAAYEACTEKANAVRRVQRCKAQIACVVQGVGHSFITVKYETCTELTWRWCELGGLRIHEFVNNRREWGS